MSWALGLAIALTRTWTATYTRGLPRDLRAERREEIDCDLWEHHRLVELERQPAASAAAQVFLRLILGIPEDILWRFEAASSQIDRRTSMNETLPMRIGFLAAIFPLALLAVMGVSFMLGNGDWENSFGHWLWRIAFVTTPAIGAIGLWLCATQPKLGMALVLTGVGTSAFLMPWMAVVTVPFGIAIIAFATVRGGLISWPATRRKAT